MVAGVVGAMLGLGGGIVVIPALTLLFGVNIRYAVGASIVSVIATSSGAAASYVRDRITNVRVAILLEVATACGALTGALLAPYVAPRALFGVFAVILAYSALSMLRARREEAGVTPGPGDPLAQRLRLHSSYPDASLGREVPYRVENVALGWLFMLGAGLISGLLGVGSGTLKVPAMDRAMKLPLKVSSATSNFMIGVTAAAGAGTYFMRGDVLPELAAPVAIGVLFGSWIGAKAMVRTPSRFLRLAFVIVLWLVALQMALRALGLEGAGNA